eukprot:3005822-Rhodomonas_salina.2
MAVPAVCGKSSTIRCVSIQQARRQVERREEGRVTKTAAVASASSMETASPSCRTRRSQSKPAHTSQAQARPRAMAGQRRRRPHRAVKRLLGLWGGSWADFHNCDVGGVGGVRRWRWHWHWQCAHAKDEAIADLISVRYPRQLSEGIGSVGSRKAPLLGRAVRLWMRRRGTRGGCEEAGRTYRRRGQARCR